MNKLTLVTLICFSASTLFAQQKPAAVQPAPGTAVVKVVPMVPTKELKKQLERNFKRKKYKKVIPIADTLLTRNKKDENAFMKKVASKIFLSMDKSAIADLKAWYKNKDTAALMIAIMPGQFGFREKKRSGELYYQTALKLSPKSGIPHILYAAELADQGKAAEALSYGDKAWGMLSANYKKIFTNTYAEVMFFAGEKEKAYQTLEEAITSGNNHEDNLRSYFRFYMKDKRYQDGINKATEWLPNDADGYILSRRAMLYNEMGNKDKACEDAMALREKGSYLEYLLKEFQCPQVMADITPNEQRTYIYEVQFNGETYDFRVTNPLVDMDNGVSFRFKMTGEVGNSGKITISKDAIATAHAQMNRFGNSDVDLTDQTSVWVSKEVFNDIKTKGETVISADMFGEKQYERIVDDYNDDDDYYTVTVDGQEKYIKCVKIGSKDGDEEIWINDDPKNPLILKMKLSFSIELKQVL